MSKEEFPLLTDRVTDPSRVLPHEASVTDTEDIKLQPIEVVKVV